METALRSLLDWYERAGVDIPPVVPAARVKRAQKNATAQHTAGQSRINSDTDINKDTNKGFGRNSNIKPKSASVSGISTSSSDDNQIHTDRLRAATSLANKAQTLEELRLAIMGFNAGPLSDNARGAVFSAGLASAKLMIIGEAATREDDIEGAPFSGSDGLLLARMLGAIGLSSEAGAQDYYAALSVPWRGPQNRSLNDREIEISRPFLERHIELAAPNHLVLLGSTPMRALTQSRSIMKDHGQWQNVKIAERVIPAIAVYHPSLLRKQPDLKKEAWRDLLTLREALLA